MKNQILSLAVMVIVAMAITSITHAAYYPIKLVNNTGNTKSSIFPYVILTAQDTTTENNQCVLLLIYDSVANAQVASLVPINANMHSWDYTYRIDSLEGYDPVTKSVKILIPNSISGRCMVSLNYKLIMPVVSADTQGTEWVFQDPSVNNPADLNYDVIFDKFEFTYNQNNNFYIDPTAVDFFSIPIGLQSNNQSSGAAPGAVRSKLMKAITGVLDSALGNAWDSLVIRNSGTLMRITAPYLAPAFNTSYLTQPGYNYIDSLVKYYQSNVVRINCSELDVAGDEIFDNYNVSPTQDSGAYIFTSSPIVNNHWVFTNNPLSATGSPMSDTIDMSIAKSSNFFGPGTAPFITPNKTVISILVKNITAAFTVGLLPAPDSMMLDSSYLSNTKSYPYYGKNKQLDAAKGTGPWYNLYTRAMHKAIPQIYAFAFDDVLGQSGTLESNDNSDTITVTLGDMGAITLPKHSNLMTVLSDSLIYNSGFVHVGSNYIDTFKWKVPAGQPANAQYFFMGSGADFTIPPQQFLTYQLGNFFTAYDTVGWISIPDSLLKNSNNLNIPMAVYTCGGPSNPCPTNDSNWTSWTQATASNLLPLPDSAITPVALVYNSGLVHVGNSYIDTFRWNIPPGQPDSTQYFFMGSGPDFTITPQQFLSYQYGNFFTAYDTIGWVSIPDSMIMSCNSLMIPMAVYACGGSSIPCPTSSSNWTQWTNGTASNLLPLLDSTVSPVTTKTFATLTASGNNYQANVTWTIPPYQPSNAEYFFVVSGPGFLFPVDSMIAWQVNDGLYTSTDTTGILTLPAAAININKLDSINVAVFTCGGPGYPCPTKANINYWTCDEGSAPISQTSAAATLKLKKKKKK